MATVRSGLVASATMTALAAGHAFPAAVQPLPWLRRSLGVESQNQAGHGVALTFDDGPHPAGTPAMLNALAAAGTVATFFLVGEQVARYPTVACEIAAAGHAIGLHGDRHRNLLRLTPRQTTDDLVRGYARIAEVTGVSPDTYRPPYGVLNASALSHARRCGWRVLLWSAWGRDWEPDATPDSVVELVTRGLHHGSVLLLHDADHYSAPDSWRATAAAVPRILARLAARGLPAVAA